MCMKINLLTKLIPATFIAVGLFIGCSGGHDHDHDHDHDHNGHNHGNGGEKQSSVPDDYPLDVCVVGGEKLGSMGKPVVIKHEGVTVKFCCEGCIEDFEKDPKKFIAKLEAAKKGAQCPFCKKYFPHGDIMGHKLKCSKNDTDLDLTPKPGSKTKPAEEKPETKPEGKGNKNGEAEKPAETKPKNSDGEGKKPAGQGDGEKE